MYFIMSLKGNRYKYIWTGFDVASRCKVIKALKTKKANKVALVLEEIYKKSGVFKYPKGFKSNNGSEFENNMTKLLKNTMLTLEEKQKIQSHSHSLVEVFNKEFEKYLFKATDAQELQNPEKVATVWVKNLDISVNKIKTQNKWWFTWSQTMQLNWILPN